MTNQKSSQTAILIILVALVVGLGANPALAQDKEPQPLTRKLATRLIADFYEIGISEVKIAYILDGKLRKEGFLTEFGAEATFIRPVVQNGRRRRLMHCLTFQHDEELGWFLREIIREEGRDYIDICSEYQGRI
ncbi:MAG: hypothetical protein ACR2RV_03300, partial [Verrucomicrobiales bacterium]